MKIPYGVADFNRLRARGQIYVDRSMLTLGKEATEQRTLELAVPNEVMHGLFVERLRAILMPLGSSRSAAWQARSCR